MYTSSLHERLTSVVGSRSSRHVGELTATNHETVRRYLTGQTPSVEFLQALCKACGVSGEWLLTGKGPARATDVHAATLQEAGAGELLGALAEAVERLIERVDRLERLMQVMELRLRASPPGTISGEIPGVPAEVGNGKAGGIHAETKCGDRVPAEPRPANAACGVVAIPDRVLRLREAFAGRSRPNAH